MVLISKLSDDVLYFDEVSWKYPDQFSIYNGHAITIVKFLRGITLKIYKQELWFLWCVCRLMMLYIEWTRNDHCQISKPSNSKNVYKSYGSCGVHVVWWCLTFLWSFMKISWMVFTRNYHCWISKGNNLQNIKTRVMVFVISMSSDDDLYFDGFMKIPRLVFSLWSGHITTIVKFLNGIAPIVNKQELWFLSACHLMMLYMEWTRYDHCQISKGNNSKNRDKSYYSCGVHVVWWCFIFLWSFMIISWMVFTLITIVKFQRGITPKIYRQELQFLCCAHHLMMLYDSMIEFHEHVLKGFKL